MIMGKTQNIVEIGSCSDINLQNLLADYSLIDRSHNRPIDTGIRYGNLLSLGTNTAQKGPRINQD